MILSNLTNPAISPNLTAGDSCQWFGKGPSSSPVSECTQINGGQWYCAGQGNTDINGNCSVNGQAGILGSYNQTWYVGSTQCTNTLQFKVYPWPTGVAISKSVVQNVAAASLGVYQNNTSSDPAASPFANASSPFLNYFSHIDTIGLTPTYLNAMQSYFSSNGVPRFDEQQNYLAQAAAAMGWSSMLSSDFFRLETLTQPVLSQVTPLHTQPSWDTIGSNYGGALSWITSYVNTYGRTRHHPDQVRYVLANYYSGSNSAKDNATVASATGGVLVAGGIGLMAASGTTAAGLTTAGVAAFSMFTGGAALVVIGVGVAGYYGYQYLSNKIGTGGPNDPDPQKVGPDNFYDVYEWE